MDSGGLSEYDSQSITSRDMDRLYETLRAIRELHVADIVVQVRTARCRECDKLMPCPTLRAMVR